MTKQTLAALLIAIAVSACAGADKHAAIPAATRSEVVAHYLNGESLDQLAQDFRLETRDAARDIVHSGMLALSKRYYGDR